ncbi:hypothetical protein GQ55_6G201200 [Panicum hallii var. hallii]|uniref:Uncharacterized protein n=1 Tax=Panicum hallii var. hallii TaxID=1504633 RepID=A0A2T7D7S7_9POAL|nr:hypothetical protein GQ55_6G201200 [Panicum hallii var. hallii]
MVVRKDGDGGAVPPRGGTGVFRAFRDDDARSLSRLTGRAPGRFCVGIEMQSFFFKGEMQRLCKTECYTLFPAGSHQFSFQNGLVGHSVISEYNNASKSVFSEVVARIRNRSGYNRWITTGLRFQSCVQSQ